MLEVRKKEVSLRYYYSLSAEHKSCQRGKSVCCVVDTGCASCFATCARTHCYLPRETIALEEGRTRRAARR